jgi:hypothetical protein
MILIIIGEEYKYKDPNFVAAFGGVMDCHWTQGSRFKQGAGRWIFKGDKIHSTTSFRGEVKPWAPCRKILKYVKDS